MDDVSSSPIPHPITDAELNALFAYDDESFWTDNPDLNHVISEDAATHHANEEATHDHGKAQLSPVSAPETDLAPSVLSDIQQSATDHHDFQDAFVNGDGPVPDVFSEEFDDYISSLPTGNDDFDYFAQGLFDFDRHANPSPDAATLADTFGIGDQFLERSSHAHNDLSASNISPSFGVPMLENINQTDHGFPDIPDLVGDIAASSSQPDIPLPRVTDSDLVEDVFINADAAAQGLLDHQSQPDSSANVPADSQIWFSAATPTQPIDTTSPPSKLGPLIKDYDAFTRLWTPTTPNPQDPAHIYNTATFTVTKIQPPKLDPDYTAHFAGTFDLTTFDFTLTHAGAARIFSKWDVLFPVVSEDILFGYVNFPRHSYFAITLDRWVRIESPFDAAARTPGTAPNISSGDSIREFKLICHDETKPEYIVGLAPLWDEQLRRFLWKLDRTIPQIAPGLPPMPALLPAPNADADASVDIAATSSTAARADIIDLTGDPESSSPSSSPRSSRSQPQSLQSSAPAPPTAEMMPPPPRPSSQSTQPTPTISQTQSLNTLLTHCGGTLDPRLGWSSANDAGEIVAARPEGERKRKRRFENGNAGNGETSGNGGEAGEGRKIKRPRISAFVPV